MSKFTVKIAQGGNIYANLINSKNSSVQKNNQILKGQIFDNEIGFNINSQKKIDLNKQKLKNITLGTLK